MDSAPPIYHVPGSIQTQELIQRKVLFALSTSVISSKPLQSYSPWYFNSRASHHMTNSAKHLSNVQPYLCPLKIHTADGTSLPITVVGDVSPSLTNVFVSPGLAASLVSIGQLVDNACKVVFFSTWLCYVESKIREDELEGA